MKIDIILCVSNPIQGIFEKCVSQLLKQAYLNKIIIIHPFFDRFFYPQGEKIIKIREPKRSCLAYARYLGIQKSTAEYICFVDGDVILHKNHLKQLLEKQQTKGGVIEGVLTILDDRKNVNYTMKELKPGERGFTHNTLIFREYIRNWKPIFTCAWEDYLITQFILNQNLSWVRFPQECKSYHIKDYGIFKRNAWGTAGERMVKKLTKRTIIFRTINYFKRALIHPFLFQDVSYTKFNIKLAISSLFGYFSYNKYIYLKKVK